MGDIEAFIRDAAQKRGIDPDTAVRVANSEGSVTEPARLGDFSGPPWFSGKSWWPFQLHYGGLGYESFGNTAGMGNGFTKLTGWQPGDPKAWRDSVRYALNRAKASGWGAWFGAKAQGIVGFRGIDVNHHWDVNAEKWDYETGAGTVPKVTYNPNTPAIAQDDPWSCAPTSLRWALTSLGRNPAPLYIEDWMVHDGVVSHDQGLLDASGSGIAAWVGKKGPDYYGDAGFYANSEPSVTFDGVALEGDHAYPLLIGGRAWGHWSAVRGYDAARDLLLLANPADGWMGVQQTMSRAQWDQLGPFSMVRVLHPDLLAPPVVVPPAPPIPTVDKAAIVARLRGLLALHDQYDVAMRAEFDKLIQMAEAL